jgi:hypothetical protein
MPDPPVALQPGQKVSTTVPTITVAAMKKAGKFTFFVTVTNDAGLTATSQFSVTVKPG